MGFLLYDSPSALFLLQRLPEGVKRMISKKYVKKHVAYGVLLRRKGIACIISRNADEWLFRGICRDILSLTR
ncbi:MAG: hypothetical protein HUU01_10010 [Saprospiraceae bacterium]|nr:hypothetical protein [Saprospiraceae bacterium]